MIQPRKNRISWPDCHMKHALVEAERSPDPNTQVGACIINKENKILSVGYNSVPKGIDVDAIPWERSDPDQEKTKYPYILHAEENAIFNAENIKGLKDSIIYVTLAPCNNCAKAIIQVGIKKVIYLENPYEKEWWSKVAFWLLKEAGVEIIKHKWNIKNLSGPDFA